MNKFFAFIYLASAVGAVTLIGGSYLTSRRSECFEVVDSSRSAIWERTKVCFDYNKGGTDE